ncbi:MAG: hypothetical protein WCO55_00570 [Candidatus Falkowbacteria bacterium]
MSNSELSSLDISARISELTGQLVAEFNNLRTAKARILELWVKALTALGLACSTGRDVENPTHAIEASFEGYDRMFNFSLLGDSADVSFGEDDNDGFDHLSGAQETWGDLFELIADKLASPLPDPSDYVLNYEKIAADIAQAKAANVQKLDAWVSALTALGLTCWTGSDVENSTHAIEAFFDTKGEPLGRLFCFSKIDDSAFIGEGEEDDGFEELYHQTYAEQKTWNDIFLLIVQVLNRPLSDPPITQAPSN